MTKTIAPRQTPSPANSFKPLSKVGKNSDNPSTVFITLALDMSWRLAIVVLVPIIGGFELDRRLHTTPLLIITGFLLAMAGMALVLWQMLQTVNSLPPPKKEKRP
jgi:protein-S-isoprenylcysteine O-methyltransferase Ste14